MAIHFHCGTGEKQLWDLDGLDHCATWEVTYHLPGELVLNLGVFWGSDDNLGKAMAFAEAYCQSLVLKGDVWINEKAREA